jgi:hypothetical protein
MNNLRVCSQEDFWEARKYVHNRWGEVDIPAPVHFPACPHTSFWVRVESAVLLMVAFYP